MNILVYKTDIDNPSVADAVLASIREKFRNFDVSIDLDDCDNVLRVESSNGNVDEPGIEKILKDSGYKLERLPL